MDENTKVVSNAMDKNTQILFDALEKLAKLGNGDMYGNSVGNQIAQEALGKYEEAVGIEVKSRNKVHLL